METTPEGDADTEFECVTTVAFSGDTTLECGSVMPHLRVMLLLQLCA